VIAADAAGGDDDGLRAQRNRRSPCAPELLAALDQRRFQDLAADAGHRAIGR
jgi:hypothetical protein